MKRPQKQNDYGLGAGCLLIIAGMLLVMGMASLAAIVTKGGY